MTDIPTVITFTPDGNVQFTRGDQPAHDMLDNMFEYGDMLRVTDICMHAATKRYMIRWLEGPFRERVQDVGTHTEIFGYGITSSSAILVQNGTYEKPDEDTDDYGVLLFDTYERAVTYERMCLVALRKNGVTF